MKKQSWILAAAMLAPAVTVSQGAMAAEYRIDPAHSFVQFRIQHLGTSWLLGRFNDISGDFFYDPQADASAQRVKVLVKTASVDTNHAERDKHLRSGDFLETDEFGEASFVGSEYEGDADGGIMRGELTIHGVSKNVAVRVKKTGEGDDPWGGYRAGFEGRLQITRADFGMEYDLGPDSASMDLEIFIEGVRR
ncbi:MAG: YceI family protein [Gammaproteobacteria bacterium]